MSRQSQGRSAMSLLAWTKNQIKKEKNWIICNRMIKSMKGTLWRGIITAYWMISVISCHTDTCIISCVKRYIMMALKVSSRQLPNPPSGWSGSHNSKNFWLLRAHSRLAVFPVTYNTKNHVYLWKQLPVYKKSKICKFERTVVKWHHMSMNISYCNNI